MTIKPRKTYCLRPLLHRVEAEQNLPPTEFASTSTSMRNQNNADCSAIPNDRHHCLHLHSHIPCHHHAHLPLYHPVPVPVPSALVNIAHSLDAIHAECLTNADHAKLGRKSASFVQKKDTSVPRHHLVGQYHMYTPPSDTHLADPSLLSSISCDSSSSLEAPCLPIHSDVDEMPLKNLVELSTLPSLNNGTQSSNQSGHGLLFKTPISLPSSKGRLFVTPSSSSSASSSSSTSVSLYGSHSSEFSTLLFQNSASHTNNTSHQVPLRSSKRRSTWHDTTLSVLETVPDGRKRSKVPSEKCSSATANLLLLSSLTPSLSIRSPMSMSSTKYFVNHPVAQQLLYFLKSYMMSYRRSPIETKYDRFYATTSISQIPKHYFPTVDYLQKIQKGYMTVTLRDSMIETIKKINGACGYYHPETLYLAVNFMDRYLSKVFCRSSPQRLVLCVTAACVAAKLMEESKEPTINKLIKSSGSKDIDKKQIERMEHRLLLTLDWHLVIPQTPYTILESLLSSLEGGGRYKPSPFRHDCMILLHRLYGKLFLHYDMIYYEPSILIAAVMVHFTNKLLTAKDYGSTDLDAHIDGSHTEDEEVSFPVFDAKYPFYNYEASILELLNISSKADILAYSTCRSFLDHL